MTAEITSQRSPGDSSRLVLATMAKQEAKRLSERVIAGMRKAAAKGTKSGKVNAETEKSIQRLLRGGHGHQQDGCDRWRRDCHRSADPCEMRPFASAAMA